MIMTPLAEKIAAALRAEPRLFSEILIEFKDTPYRQILKAWGEIREQIALKRDEEEGRYIWPQGQDGGRT
jgi:hypothetical protein